MKNSRRQRLKQLQLALLFAPILLFQLTVKQANSQPIDSSSSSSSQLSPPASKQYTNRPLISGNFLVSDNSPSLLQSFSLTKQQHQQADLDNVIESTTSLLSTVSSSLGAKLALISTTSSTTSCQLPPTWAGKWYQANKEPIRVTNTEISDKGLCRDQKGDKYLFELVGKQQSSSCLVCLVINERHLNVLQYKESSCQPIPTGYQNRSSSNNLQLDEDHSLLDSICSDITGDAQLESLFRLETPAIECPINGQYSFTYDNCREPQSSLDSCIDKKQLNFKFSACPDVPGSESKSEVLKCYADWSEGNNYYMIGRLEHTTNLLDKGKFRCFVYEKSQDGKFIQMAQSLEESCYGLINANEGPKTMRLAAKPPTTQKCNFPSYIQSQSENWLSVDNTLIYMFNQNSSKYQVKETKEGNVIEEATCLQQIPLPHHRATSQPQQQVLASRRYPSLTSNYAQADQSLQQVSSKQSTTDAIYLVQITKNCHTTNYCVRFYKRSNGIVQIDYFIKNPGDNQCRSVHTGTPQTQVITSTNLEHQRCPFEGAYTIEAPIESDLSYNPSNIFICPRQSSLIAQCDHPSRLRIHSKCSPNKFSIKNLYCLGSWTTSGLVRLLLADDDRQRYSAWYRDYGVNQEGIPIVDTPQQPYALQQQPVIHRMPQNQHPVSPLTSIIDLQIALITPVQIVAKPMQVRLTRRNACSDLRGYVGQWSHGSPITQPIPSYSSPNTISSSAMSAMPRFANYLNPFLLILIVKLLAHSIGRSLRI